MKRALLLVVAIAGCHHNVDSPFPERDPPAPRRPPPPAYEPPAPTLRLPTNFHPERYVARLAVDPAQPTFTGELAITGALERDSAAIWLDATQLTIHAATATRDGGTAVPLVAIPHAPSFVELRPGAPLPAGHYTLALAYDGAVQPDGTEAGAYLSRDGETRYLVTQFEATSARLVFPCVDEPGSKVPWQLTLDVPKGLVAASNTPVARETLLDATHERVAFAPTRPLPSYLIAFAVGPYDVVDAGHSTAGVPLRVLVPHGRAAEAAYAAQMFPKIVDALAAWTEVPYPYPKLDLVVRDGGGAMENAGIILMEGSHVMVGSSPAQHHAVVNYVAHETAHQWFGDLVTAAWWDDIWLNEAFAQFMEAKVETAVEPAWHDEAEVVVMRISAADRDSLVSARKIRQPIETEGDIHNAFDFITYIKGASVLSMIEAWLGPDVFRRGIGAYLRAHADGNATVGDVMGALASAAGKPVAPAFATFLDQPGVPELGYTVACAAGKPARVALTQHRYVAPGTPPPAAQVWRIPLCVAYETAAHARAQTCTVLGGATAEVELPESACPAWVWPDAGATVYARIAPTDAQATALRDHAWSALTAAERRLVAASVLARAADGDLALPLAMSFPPKLLGGDRFDVGLALGDLYLAGDATGLPGALERYLPPALLPAARAKVRAEVAPLVEKLGIAPRADDTLDQESVRQDVVAAATWAREPALVKEALALAPHYRELPLDERRQVLALAVEASPQIAAQVRADALAEGSPEKRRSLYAALGSIRDPERLRAMLDLALDPKTRPWDAVALLRNYSTDSRPVVEAWLRAHFAELMHKIPPANDDFPPLLFLRPVFSDACDPARRDELASYLTATFAGMPVGARPTQNSIEQLDQCIAKRARLEPALRAWLAAPAH